MNSTKNNSTENLEEKIKALKDDLKSGKISESEFQTKKDDVLSGAFSMLEPSAKVDPSEIFFSERIKKEWQVLSKDPYHFWIPLIIVLLISIPIIYYVSTSTLQP